MSKVINLEVVDILDGIVVLETESGFEIEMDCDSVPDNIKIGQSIKCVLSLNTNTVYKESYEKDNGRLPNGKHLTY